MRLNKLIFFTLLLSLPGISFADKMAFETAEFPSFLPAFTAPSEPMSKNNAGGNILIHQNFRVEAPNIDLFAKDYMKALRTVGWQIRTYQRKTAGQGLSRIVIGCVHPDGYELRLVINNTTVSTESKTNGLRVKMILRKEIKLAKEPQTN